MKTTTLFFIGIILTFASCSSNSSKNNPTASQLECNIKGMTCQGCEMTITAKLENIDGIKVNSIDHKTGKAFLTVSKEIVPLADIRSTINDAGYECISISKVQEEIADTTKHADE